MPIVGLEAITAQALDHFKSQGYMVCTKNRCIAYPREWCTVAGHVRQSVYVTAYHERSKLHSEDDVKYLRYLTNCHFYTLVTLRQGADINRCISEKIKHKLPEALNSLRDFGFVYNPVTNELTHSNQDELLSLSASEKEAVCNMLRRLHVYGGIYTRNLTINLWDSIDITPF